MRFFNWLYDEGRAIIFATVYFGSCFFVILALKRLLLEEYHIGFSAYFSAAVLALVAAKVAVVFDRVSFGSRIGLNEVLIRTTAYSFAAFILLLIEHAVSARHEAGGFAAALLGALRHPDAPRIWATLICVGLAFAAYNAAAVLRRELGAERLLAAYLRPPAAADQDISNT